jgi:putative flippase GtrA
VSKTFLRFLLVGGVAAAANWGSRFAFQQAMSFHWAVIAAYFVGMTTAYLLSRIFVFERSGRSMSAEAGRFALVNFFAAGLVWLISVGLAQVGFPAIGFTWHPEAVAHAIGVLSPAVSSYLAHRHFTFAKAVTYGE